MPIGTLGLLGLGLASTLGSTGLNLWQNRKTRSFNASEAEKARAFSALEAQKQREFEERMSSTAYQRQVEDMKKAGINPAAIGVSGASTPVSGIPATSEATSGYQANLNLDFNQLINSALVSTFRNKGVTNQFEKNLVKNSKILTDNSAFGLKDSDGVPNAFEIDWEKEFGPNGGFEEL